MNGEMPVGWTETKLKEVGEWKSGGTPSRKQEGYFGGGIQWVKSGDLKDGPLLSTEETITASGLKSSAAKMLPPGTISMAMYGATIGRLGILSTAAATNQACANVIPYSGLLDPKYLFYYLLSERSRFIEKGQGGAQPNISQEIILDHPIPIAPLPEQRRIVAKLDELLAKLDGIQDHLEGFLIGSRTTIPGLGQTNSTVDKLRRSILVKAFRGELVPQDPNDEPAERLLERIRKERAKDLVDSHQTHRQVKRGERPHRS